MQKSIEEGLMFVEYLYEFLIDKKNISHVYINKYMNGIYRQYIIAGHQYNMEYKTKILLHTGTTDFKRFIKSIIMAVSVKLYCRLCV
jgi:hypothetical protein